jgi:hypothetical protein
VDARRAPQRILDAHACDKRPQFLIDSCPARWPPRLPAPVKSETGSMPSDQSFWADDRDHAEDRLEPLIQEDEGPAVPVRPLGPPFILRRKTISCWRRAAFSASSRHIGARNRGNVPVREERISHLRWSAPSQSFVHSNIQIFDHALAKLL